jgi:hypothetical protein
VCVCHFHTGQKNRKENVVKNSWLPGLISHFTSYKGVAYLGQGGIYIYKRYTCVFRSRGWRRNSRGLVIVVGTFGMNVSIERLGWVQTKESTHSSSRSCISNRNTHERCEKSRENVWRTPKGILKGIRNPKVPQ